VVWFEVTGRVTDRVTDRVFNRVIHDCNFLRIVELHGVKSPNNL